MLHSEYEESTGFNGLASEEERRDEEYPLDRRALSKEVQGEQLTHCIVEFYRPSEREMNKSLISIPSLTSQEMSERVILVTDILRKKIHKKPSDNFIKIVRLHFLMPILNSLTQVQSYAKSPAAAVYIDEILHNIREMEKRSSSDPFLEVLFAFYDSLAPQGLWATYTAKQFAKARDVIIKISRKYPLSSSIIEKAILQLEEIGFETTPYSLASD